MNPSLRQRLHVTAAEAREQEAKRAKVEKPNELDGVLMQYHGFMETAAKSGCMSVILVSEFYRQYPEPDRLCMYQLTHQQFNAVITKLSELGLDVSDADRGACLVQWD